MCCYQRGDSPATDKTRENGDDLFGGCGGAVMTSLMRGGTLHIGWEACVPSHGEMASWGDPILCDDNHEMMAMIIMIMARDCNTSVR